MWSPKIPAFGRLLLSISESSGFIYLGELTFSAGALGEHEEDDDRGEHHQEERQGPTGSQHPRFQGLAGDPGEEDLLIHRQTHPLVELEDGPTHAIVHPCELSHLLGCGIIDDPVVLVLVDGFHVGAVHVDPDVLRLGEPLLTGIGGEHPAIGQGRGGGSVDIEGQLPFPVPHRGGGGEGLGGGITEGGDPFLFLPAEQVGGQLALGPGALAPGGVLGHGEILRGHGHKNSTGRFQPVLPLMCCPSCRQRCH
ncbi:hypothetical protein [Corynebacterium efficiens YS-314]|uniref:Uncharacterized protein n=1 Tax=Corynebacterium efficiens (strain DSM 44549 / YS-314 / AJ 12310 / JCM 11189 / NBRC 100395) TaxID=196164 RepID=Q8FNG7_COREF|nr:hypothetical protein [Corynebacterium efficiens YS-314]